MLKRKLLFIFFVISFLPLAFMSVYSYVSLYANIHERAEQEMLNTLTQICKNVEYRLNVVEKYSRNMALSVQLGELLRDNDFNKTDYHTIDVCKKIDKIVVPFVYDDDMLRGISLFKNNVNVYSYSNGGLLDLDLAGFEENPVYQKTMLKDGQIAKGLLAEAEPMLIFGRALRDAKVKQGKPYGALIIFMDEKAFSSLSTSSNSEFMIVDEEGLVVSANPKSKISENVSGEAFFQKIQQSNSVSGYFTDPINGVATLTAYSTILGWRYSVISFMPEKQLRAPSQNLLYTTAEIYTVLLAGIFLLSLFLSRVITKPVRVIKESMDALEKGDFETRIGLRRKDEFGDILACKT